MSDLLRLFVDNLGYFNYRYEELYRSVFNLVKDNRITEVQELYERGKDKVKQEHNEEVKEHIRLKLRDVFLCPLNKGLIY